MSLRIDEFKANLTNGGARPNLFECFINSPSVRSGVPTNLTSFMCKAAALPGSVVTQIDVNFRGRVLKVAGDRTFENWTVTMINEASFGVRNSFERWLDSINMHQSGRSENPSPLAYQADIEIHQLDRTNTKIKSYTLRGAFPVNLGQIDLSFDTVNDLETFTVEFAYQYWTSNTTR